MTAGFPVVLETKIMLHRSCAGM